MKKIEAIIRKTRFEDVKEAMERNREEIAREKEALIEAQQQVADFKKSLFDMYKTHLELISSMPETFEEATGTVQTAEQIAAAVTSEEL